MPYKNKEDYNRNRIKYRKRIKKEERCIRCYRPLIEESGNVTCLNCIETNSQRRTLNKELTRGF